VISIVLSVMMIIIIVPPSFSILPSKREKKNLKRIGAFLGFDSLFIPPRLLMNADELT
jgi:hypothetical protein